MMGLTTFRANRAAKRGFTLIELAIVLGVSSLLFAGLWRLMSSGNAQIRDRAAADQQKQLIEAVQGYLTSTDGQTLVRGIAGLTTATATLPSSCPTPTGMCAFLPPGFLSGTTNSYGQTFSVRVRKDSGEAAGTDAKAYSFMVVTSGGSVIPDTSGGRISSMIGNDGGFIYTANVCGATPANACGSYGAWSSLLSDYGFAGTVGHIASRTYMGYTGAQTSIWLARMTATSGPTLSTGQPDYNTMQTNMYFKRGTLTETSGTNDLFLSNNTLFGGPDTAQVGGALSKIYNAELGTTLGNYLTVNGSLDTVTTSRTYVTIGAPCQWPSNNSCAHIALAVQGDATVSGRLVADYLNAGYFVYTSDARLKHDVKTLENPLDTLAKLRGVSYIANKDEKKRYGLIAQEVAAVYPEIVHPLGQGDYLGIDYIGLIGPMVEAIKELKHQNEDLRATVEAQGKALKELQEKAAK